MKQHFSLSLFLILLFVLTGCNLPAVKPITTLQAILTPTATFVVPTATPTLQPTVTKKPVCHEMSGKVESHELVDLRLDKPIRYLVYIPPCYDFSTNKDRKYPVLYLLHGQNSDEEQWLRIGVVKEADNAIWSKELPPFVMVFPFDYSIKQPNQYPYEDVFMEKLVPEVDQNYRILPGRSNHAIGGLSRGGAWALHLGIRNPQVFGIIGGHSPVIFYADHANLPASLLKLSAAEMPRIWLDIGNSDSELRLMRQFEQFLTNNQIPHTWNVFEGYHEEKYWSAHVAEYLAWYAGQWSGR